MTDQKLDETIFAPHWPEGVSQDERYRVLCDDRGRNGSVWLEVSIAPDGDVHVMMQEWEDPPEGRPDPFPTIRVRTLAGGGRNMRTRQALLWLAKAIQLDAEGMWTPSDLRGEDDG